MAKQQPEIELDKQQHEVEMTKLAQQEKDREVKLTHIESNERQVNQDRETNFERKIEFRKLGDEKPVHAPNPTVQSRVFHQPTHPSAE